MEANREASAVLGNCSVDLQAEGGLCLSLRRSLCSESGVHVCTGYKIALPLLLLCMRQIKICFCRCLGYVCTGAFESVSLGHL